MPAKLPWCFGGAAGRRCRHPRLLPSTARYYSDTPFLGSVAQALATRPQESRLLQWLVQALRRARWHVCSVRPCPTHPKQGRSDTKSPDAQPGRAKPRSRIRRAMHARSLPTASLVLSKNGSAPAAGSAAAGPARAASTTHPNAAIVNRLTGSSSRDPGN